MTNACRVQRGVIIDFDFSHGAPVRISTELTNALTYEPFITFKNGDQNNTLPRVTALSCEALAEVIAGQAPEGETITDIYGIWGYPAYDAGTGELNGFYGLASVETEDGVLYLVKIEV